MTDNLPVSALRNYPEVLQHCDDGSVVYLTNNGHSKYVIQSLASYEKMEATIQLLAALSKGAASADLSIDEAFAGLES